MIALIVGIVVAGLVLWFLVIPVLLALVDVMLLVALVVFGILSHAVLRRRWEVEARCGHKQLTWLVLGWSRSGRAVTAVADRLEGGIVPPTDSPHFPPP